MSGLICTLENEVLRLTVNRPEHRNPLSIETLEAIAERLSEYRDHTALKIAVIRGAGDKSFAAGGDLKQLDTFREHSEAKSLSVRLRRALDAVRHFPLPVIAALNGNALGGGSELALACDMRVATQIAKIAFVQGRLNISSGWGGGIDALQKLGSATAMELFCSKEWVSGERAVSLGLVNRLTDDNQSIDEAVDEFIAPMLEQRPHVLRSFKAMALAHSQGASRSELEELEASQFADNWVHPDHWEAVDRVFKKV